MEERVVTEEKMAPAPEPARLPMAWHRFQKNFFLWVIALFYCARAFLTASGNIYYEASIRAAVYAGMPLLRILDYAFAAHCAAAAVLCVISAIRVNRHGANLLRKTYIALAAGEAAYMLLRWLVSGLPPVNPQGICLMIAHLLLYFANRSYYRKRNCLSDRKEAL